MHPNSARERANECDVRIENQRTAAAAAAPLLGCCCTAHGICKLDRAKEEEKVRHVGAPPQSESGRKGNEPARTPASLCPAAAAVRTLESSTAAAVKDRYSLLSYSC